MKIKGLTLFAMVFGLFLLPGASMAQHNVGCNISTNFGGRADGSVTHQARNTSTETWVGVTWCLGTGCPTAGTANNRFVGYSGEGNATISQTTIVVTGLSIGPGEVYTATLTHAGTYVQYYTFLDPLCTSEAGSSIGEASKQVYPSEQIQASWNPGAELIDVTYTPACGASDHSVYFGPLSAVGTYDWSGLECGFGTTGTMSFDPLFDSIFFVVVGNDGAIEGSYGLDGSDVERPEDIRVLACEKPQDLDASCD